MPATAGPLMLVPDSLAKEYVIPLNSTVSVALKLASVKELIDDSTDTPGAEISGFRRPSSVGPRVEKLDTFY